MSGIKGTFSRLSDETDEQAAAPPASARFAPPPRSEPRRPDPAVMAAGAAMGFVDRSPKPLPAPRKAKPRVFDEQLVMRVRATDKARFDRLVLHLKMERGERSLATGEVFGYLLDLAEATRSESDGPS